MLDSFTVPLYSQVDLFELELAVRTAAYRAGGL
jgi:hypothetical protein